VEEDPLPTWALVLIITAYALGFAIVTWRVLDSLNSPMY